MARMLLALVLLLPACASTTNPDALRDVQVPPGIAEQNRADCERQGESAGAEVVSGPFRHAYPTQMWPFTEISVAQDRDNAARSVYVRCLREAFISSEAAQRKQNK